MNLSKPGNLKPVEPLSILLIGPPGGGKTTLGMQFPFPCFLDCDRNLDGPERYNRKLNPNLEYAYVGVTYDSNGKPLAVEKCYDNLLLEIDNVAKESAVKTIVLDGITLINQFIVQKVLKQSSKDSMEMRDWGKVAAAFINLLYVRLRQTGKTTIVMCHEVPVERANEKNPMLKDLIKYEPAINGGIAHTMSGLFTDVWRCSSLPAVAGKVQFKIQTTKDVLSGDLKNSLGLPSEIIVKEGESAWSKIQPYMPKP